MTPKEQSAKLRYKYSVLLDLKTTDEKVLKCSIIAVDEIIRVLQDEQDWYWPEVKQELEKL